MIDDNDDVSYMLLINLLMVTYEYCIVFERRGMLRVKKGRVLAVYELHVA